MRFVPRSLTSRLVVTAVALVAVVGILVAASATIAMRSYLYDSSGRWIGFRTDPEGRCSSPRKWSCVGAFDPRGEAHLTLYCVLRNRSGMTVVPNSV